MHNLHQSYIILQENLSVAMQAEFETAEFETAFKLGHREDNFPVLDKRVHSFE